MSIAIRLKQIRSEHRLSQTELARLANVSQPTIVNWENGSHSPHRDKLETIAIKLDLDLLWLLSGDGEASRRMATPYLTQAIYHIPIYDWPYADHTFSSLKPIGYLPFCATHPPKFAIKQKNIDAGRDHIWIIDDLKQGSPDQPHLIVKDQSYHVIPNLSEHDYDLLVGAVLASIDLYHRSNHRD